MCIRQGFASLCVVLADEEGRPRRSRSLEVGRGGVHRWAMGTKIMKPGELNERRAALTLKERDWLSYIRHKLHPGHYLVSWTEFCMGETRRSGVGVRRQMLTPMPLNRSTMAMGGSYQSRQLGTLMRAFPPISGFLLVGPSPCFKLPRTVQRRKISMHI